MNDLATAPPQPARLSATVTAPAVAMAAPGWHLWQRLLDASPLLTAADGSALDALVAQRVLAAGDWVFSHRTPARSLVLLLEGTVSLGHSDGAAMAPERLVRGPAWLDPASAWLAGATHALDARAIGTVRVGDLPRAGLQTLMTQRPALAPGFLAVLADQVQRLSLQTHELMHKDANSRLAAWLHRHLPSSPGAQDLLQLNERKRDIAAQLGMSPETLSRQMRQLSRRGLIEVRGYQVRVLDSAGLQRLAVA
jgi:CRP-like cAMP-binding protein